LSNELIICTIDGKEIFCEEGWTILQAARANNIEIPVLCYFPDISIIGSCRICVVEIEGERLLYTACSTPVKNGMIIHTKSERVMNARRLVIEMMLSQHFGDCLTCDGSGDCLLEKYAYEFGATGKMFAKAEFRELTHGIDDRNPFIIHDRGKCILCGICVRVCEQWSHRNALSFVHKGNKIMVSTMYNKGLEDNKECIFCGNCVTACPTAALYEKNAIRSGRLPEIKRTKTICPYCGVGCGIVVYSKDNKIVKVRGDLSSPVSRGRLCIKGKFGLDYVNSNQRLLKPLVRDEDGNLKEVELIDALLLIKQKIDEIMKKNGTFAGLASAKCTNEDNFVFQKFFRTILKSDNIDHCARICHSSTVSGLEMTFGSGAMTNPIEDIDLIDCFLIIGSNMLSSHPVIAWKIIKRVKEGAIMILIDPKKSGLSRYATLQLQINPGSDISLINAMLKIIIEERMFDTEMVEKRAEGFEELVKRLDTIRLEDLVKDTGVDENDIRLASRLFAISGASAIYYAMGITQHIFGTANVISLANLSIITGKVGQGPNGLNPLRGQNNVQGSCDMGCLPGVLPGYKKIENKEDNEFFSKFWGTDIPQKKGRTLVEITKAIEEGDINFLYIMGENPVLSDPDSEHVKEALKKVEFLVVQDIFLTETAELADVVLPTTSFAEKEGTFTNTERRIQKVNRVIEPISPTLLEDWKIITRLAELFGVDWGYLSWRDIFKEIRESVDIYSHIDIDQIEKKEYLWPGNQKGESIKRLHQDQFTRGKAKIIYQEPNIPYKTNEKYPFLLIIGRLYEHYHTGTMTRKIDGINTLQPYSKVCINPKDAVKLKIKNDDWVKIVSEKGEIKARCFITLDVKQGNAFISFHFKEANANELTSDKELDPFSKIANMKVVPVNIIPL